MRSISGIIPSPDQRGSLAAASRKSRKAIAFVVCDGPVGTMTGVASGRGAVARGVADRAGLGDAREAHGLLGEADRQLAALLPGDAEGAVAARAGQQVAEHPRQHVEDRIGDAEVRLGAERAVLEALLRGLGAELGAARRLDVAADLLRHLAEELVPGVDAAGDAEDRRAPRRSRATLYQGPASAAWPSRVLPQKVFRCSISARFSSARQRRCRRDARRCRCRGRGRRRRCRSSAARRPGSRAAASASVT